MGHVGKIEDVRRSGEERRSEGIERTGRREEERRWEKIWVVG